jgi:hypothetical protein
MRGSVKVANFDLNLFRREATLDHFNVRFDPKLGDVGEVDGLITVDYADYTVKIAVLGSTKQPQVKLASDPPLPEDQLVAVLLFGKPIDELDSEETGSVGDTRAAVQDSALSLASLYLLASTPVQSVGYDSRTGSVTAKVRLATGTSLNVGAGQESQQVGVSKRLGKRWSVSTDVIRSTQGTQTFTAFLEWNNRY